MPAFSFLLLYFLFTSLSASQIDLYLLQPFLQIFWFWIKNSHSFHLLQTVCCSTYPGNPLQINLMEASTGLVLCPKSPFFGGGGFLKLAKSKVLNQTKGSSTLYLKNNSTSGKSRNSFHFTGFPSCFYSTPWPRATPSHRSWQVLCL